MHVHCTLPFHIKGWQGGAPSTGAALTGGSHPHTCKNWPPILASHLSYLSVLLVPFTSPLAPSTVPPRPSMPILTPQIVPFVPSAPVFTPHAPSVCVGTPCAHTPCTIHVHAPAIHTCSIHAVHAIPMCTICIHMSMPHRLCVTDNPGVQLSLSIVE